MDPPCEWAPDTPEYRRIKEAVLKNDIEAFTSAYNRNIKLDALYGNGSEGRSLLHIAASKGHADVIQCLKAHGANINLKTRDEFGSCTPLFLAASVPDYNTVWLLLSFGADPTADGPNDETILSTILRNATSVEKRHLSVIDLLLNRGFDINRRASDVGHTILEHAIGLNDQSILEHLIRRGATLETSIQTAAVSSGPSTINFLLSRGATDPSFGALICAARHNKVSNIHALLQASRQPRDRNAYTALTTAAMLGHIGAVRLLLDTFHFDVNAYDTQGATALHAACAGDPPNLRVIKLLIEHRADTAVAVVNTAGSVNGKRQRSLYIVGDTPLHTAVVRSNPTLISLLLSALTPPPLSTRNQSGATPLHVLATTINGPCCPRVPANQPSENHPRLEAGRILLVKMSRAEINARDAKGWTALMRVCAAGTRGTAGRRVSEIQVAVAKVLVEKGADVGVKDREGKEAGDLIAVGDKGQGVKLRAILTGRKARGSN